MPEWLLDLFARYGYAVVFVGVLLENTGVPVPWETILLEGAALAQFGRLSLGGVIATAVAGAILGDNFGFFSGRHGGRTLAERYGPGLGSTFLLFNAAGAVVWSVAVAAAGYLLAYSWDTLERLIGELGLAAFVLFLLVVVRAVTRARRHREP